MYVQNEWDDQKGSNGEKNQFLKINFKINFLNDSLEERISRLCNRYLLFGESANTDRRQVPKREYNEKRRGEGRSRDWSLD